MRGQKTKVIFIHVSEAEARWIRNKAKEKVISMTEVLRRLIMEKMDAEGIQN